MSFTFLQVTQHILQFLLNWPTFLELLHFWLVLPRGTFGRCCISSIILHALSWCQTSFV